MSAAENYSSTYHRAQLLTERDSMLADGSVDISVTSRIDYNLRFTKQAVLVVGNNAGQYSHLASQFLVSLSNVNPTVGELAHQDNHINVAFVSATLSDTVSVICSTFKFFGIERVYFSRMLNHA